MKLLMIILILTFSYAEDWDKSFRDMSAQQRAAIIKTFVNAIPDDLSFSLAAIHFKESKGSKYMFNINSSTSIDVGAFMINTKEYNRRLKRKNNKWNTARAMEELKDYDTNYIIALDNFKYCLKEAKGNYKLAYQYYNGWKSGSKRSKQYAKDVYQIRKVLEKYFNHPTIKGMK